MLPFGSYWGAYLNARVVVLSLYVFVYECVRVRVCPPARVFVEQVAQAGPASMTKYIEVVLALGIQVQICDYTSARSRFF